MSESGWQGADDCKSEIFPKAQRAFVGRDDEVELHRPEPETPSFVQTMLSDRSPKITRRAPRVAQRTAADIGCELRVWSRYMNISAKRITLTLPEIGLIAMTRGALGVGIGLLLSNALEKEERRSAGLALLAVGVLTTVPILMRLRNELK